MKIRILLLLSVITFCCSAQSDIVFQFENYLVESGERINSFVQIEIDSNKFAIGYYTPDPKNAKLTKFWSYHIDSITHNHSNSEYEIHCGPFNFTFKKNDLGQLTVNKVYFNRILNTYQNENKFITDNSIIIDQKKRSSLTVIQNPQFDYLVAGSINKVQFFQNGVPISNLYVRGTNCKVDSKYGVADITEISDSIVTLFLVNTIDSTTYFQKQFVVKTSDEPIPVPKNYYLEFHGGEIAANGHSLIFGQANSLYLTDWESTSSEFKFAIENGTFISYFNGILELKPNKIGKVKVTVTEKETGYLVVSSEFIAK